MKFCEHSVPAMTLEKLNTRWDSWRMTSAVSVLRNKKKGCFKCLSGIDSLGIPGVPRDKTSIEMEDRRCHKTGSSGVFLLSGDSVLRCLLTLCVSRVISLPTYQKDWKKWSREVRTSILGSETGYPEWVFFSSFWRMLGQCCLLPYPFRFFIHNHPPVRQYITYAVV